ncbi:MAG: hypothetical protein ACYC27_14000 [Armatimonadota bacterium]
MYLRRWGEWEIGKGSDRATRRWGDGANQREPLLRLPAAGAYL